MSTASAVTDSSFEQEVLQSDVPVLVDFWAPCCGPCRMVAPIVEEISKDFQVLRLKGRIWFSERKLPLQIQMVGPRISTWFEEAPGIDWAPRNGGGIDIVVLSLDECSEDRIRKLISERIS